MIQPASGSQAQPVQPRRSRERAFGERLRFPAEFAGRGDMSRGGLMLRCAREGRELTYVLPSEGARHGKRPPRLVPIPGILTR